MNNYTGRIEEDAEAALDAELKTMHLLELLHSDKEFVSRHYDKECWHKGDIEDSEGIFWEVKDCRTIHRTGNVFLEDVDQYGNPGWLHRCTAKYLCVLDQIDGYLYILDFAEIRLKYRKYLRKRVASKGGYGYVISLKELRKNRVVLSQEMYFLDPDGVPDLMI